MKGALAIGLWRRFYIVSKTKSGENLLLRLWHDFVRHHWLRLVGALFFMILEAGAMYVFVTSLEPMIDDVFNGGQSEKIWPITLVICGVFIVRGVGSYIHRVLTVQTGVYVVSSIQQRLIQHLLRLDMSFFNRHSPGELIERVRGDTQALQSMASGTLLTVGRDATTLAGMLVAAIQIDWFWTLVVFVGAPVLVLPISVLRKLIRYHARKARHASAQLTTRLDEIFHGMKAIKLNSLTAHERSRFKEGIDEFVRRNLLSQYSNAAMPSMIDIIAGVGFVAVIYYGGQQIVAGEKTTGMFITFFTAIGLMFDPIRRLTNISGAIQGALANLERLYYLLDQKPQPRPLATGELTNPAADIRFDNVHFSYGQVPVLKGMSFLAPGGKTTAFVGPSGAGKSTLFNLLTQLELPQEGAIYIGEDNLETISIDNLRRNISVVAQESALFDESIRDNIALGNLDAEPDLLDEIAENTLVHLFAQELPEGLDSSAGPRGTNLSGGQRQRVVIARALLRDAPILLLDEATSALDNETEAQIQMLLERHTKGRTTLVIAHRLTTVMNADLIHVVQDGVIVESGTHQSLLEKKGAYAQLHQTLE